MPYHSLRSFINFWNLISSSLRAHSLQIDERKERNVLHQHLIT